MDRPSPWQLEAGGGGRRLPQGLQGQAGSGPQGTRSFSGTSRMSPDPVDGGLCGACPSPGAAPSTCRTRSGFWLRLRTRVLRARVPEAQVAPSCPPGPCRAPRWPSAATMSSHRGALCGPWARQCQQEARAPQTRGSLRAGGAARAAGRGREKPQWPGVTASPSPCLVL